MYIKSDAYIEKATKLGEGEVEFVVSTNDLDADGQRIDVNGIDLTDFKKNPVVLWAHDGFNLPIAKATKIWKEGNKLMAVAKFYLKDEFPRKVYNYIIDGFLNAVSIGGMVDEWGEDGLTIAKLKMKEFSPVAIGSNPKALVASKSFTKNDKDELRGLAVSYARKIMTQGNDHVLKNIDVLESLVTALKEVAHSEPQEEQVNSIHVVLRQAQAVDHQVEQTIRSIKVTLKGNSNE